MIVAASTGTAAVAQSDKGQAKEFRITVNGFVNELENFNQLLSEVRTTLKSTPENAPGRAAACRLIEVAIELKDKAADAAGTGKTKNALALIHAAQIHLINAERILTHVHTNIENDENTIPLDSPYGYFAAGFGTASDPYVPLRAQLGVTEPVWRDNMWWVTQTDSGQSGWYVYPPNTIPIAFTFSAGENMPSAPFFRPTADGVIGENDWLSFALGYKDNASPERSYFRMENATVNGQPARAGVSYTLEENDNFAGAFLYPFPFTVFYVSPTGDRTLPPDLPAALKDWYDEFIAPYDRPFRGFYGWSKQDSYASLCGFIEFVVRYQGYSFAYTQQMENFLQFASDAWLGYP